MDTATVTLMSLAEVVRKARQKKGLSQEQLAEKAGVGRTLIRDMEQGKPVNPTLKKIGKIADLLGLNLHKLWKEHRDMLT